MRLRTTHDVTIYDEAVVGENDLGVALTASATPVVEVRGRYRPQGEGLVRENRSERIDRSPSVVVQPEGRDPETGDRVALMDALEEGQHVDVSGGRTEQPFAVMRIIPHYGRDGGPERITLELQGLTQDGESDE